MQFTELSELQQLCKKESTNVGVEQQKLLIICPSQIPSKSQLFTQVLTRIGEINESQSVAIDTNIPNLPDVDEIEDAGDSVDFFQAGDNGYELLSASLSKTRSLIFAPIKSSEHLTVNTPNQFSQSLESSTHHQCYIKIYYLGQSYYKFIRCEPSDTVTDIIMKALNEYRGEEKFDQELLICSTDPELYELRFCENPASFKPDMQVDALERNRVLYDLILEVLVLVQVDGRDQFRKSRQIIADQLWKYESQGLCKLYIYNETDDEIASLITCKNQILQRVYEYVEKELKDEVSLKENLMDDFELPRDFQVKNLGSRKIYAKKKQFLDQPDADIIRPYRRFSQQTRNLTQNFLPPIGANDASRYEEFKVIKINSRGGKQHRVLGIDQTKIYYYKPAASKEKRTSSLFSSIIWDRSHYQDAKTPYRLVADILSIEKANISSFFLKFDDKIIKYVAANAQQRERILRKLSYLSNYHKRS